MIYWLIILFAFILVFAPVRKAFFANRNWRFTLPATAGFIFAIVMLKGVMKMNLPGLAILGISIYVALIIGFEFCNNIFGSGKRQ